ncbi:MAG: PhoH family protein [Victivallaceae bacterium]|nr:PhoH family protein [Victivallaceae bacterium]
MLKSFVLDTNVLLHDASSLEAFADNDVIIPIPVLEELDKFKKDQNAIGRNARQVIRTLDKLRSAGHLTDGVPLAAIGSPAAGRLFVAYEADIDNPKIKLLFDSEAARSADNRILAVALAARKHDHPVVFISKDINMRLKADALGFKVMDFEREKVKPDELYRGFRTIELPPDKATQFERSGIIRPPEPLDYPNEFLIVKSGEKRLLGRNAGHGEVALVPMYDNYKIWNISPRNIEQRMAFDLLMDQKVPLVTLVGGAGTGKTLLAIAAALANTLNSKRYERILVSRPIIPMGNDIGFIPGSKDDKLRNWMQPIFDNLDFLLDAPEPEKAKNGKTSSAVNSRVKNLMASGQLELEALTYIRGRSIAKQFIVVDEAQNLTPHEVKTIISRAGADTKIVLTGDPWQIDNPYLDSASNGLSYLVERMKRQAIFGHVMLQSSERSELAGLAARIL